MGHLFPFVVVPRHLSSAQMREQRPFLWKGVMLQMFFFDGKRQTALGHELLKDVLEAAFVRPQKTLDLLQGLQLLVAWFVPLLSLPTAALTAALSSFDADLLAPRLLCV
jgi:hypothetical protein